MLRPALCQLTGAPLPAAQCHPDPSVLRLNDDTELYLPRDAATSCVPPADAPLHSAVTLTASRRIKVMSPAALAISHYLKTSKRHMYIGDGSFVPDQHQAHRKVVRACSGHSLGLQTHCTQVSASAL